MKPAPGTYGVYYTDNTTLFTVCYLGDDGSAQDIMIIADNIKTEEMAQLFLDALYAQEISS